MNAERTRPSAGDAGQPGAATGWRSRLRVVTFSQWVTLGVLLATIAGSSVTWYALALRCAWPPMLAAVPTIALDLGGLLFGRNWILGESPRLRVWGRVTTILAVLLSVGGNSVEHAIAAGRWQVTLPLILAVGAVAPAALFATAHQMALEQHAAQVPPEPVPGKRRGEADRVNASEPTPEPEVVEQVGLPKRPRQARPPAVTIEMTPGAAAYVYRVFNALGRLLYIGSSPDPKERVRAHRRNQPWGADIARVITEPFDDLDAARSAETAAIRLENPLHNITDTPDGQLKRHGATRSFRVVEGGGTLLSAARIEYRRRAEALLTQGKSLDGIVLADIDRHVGAAVGYAKRHARTWRREIEAEHRQRERGEG